MTRRRSIKLALFATCVFLLGSATAITVTAQNDQTRQSGQQTSRVQYWGEIGTEYKIADYTDSVRVFDPNGQPVSVTAKGVFMLTMLGEYRVVYKEKTVSISALEQPPRSTLVFGNDEKEFSYIAGSKAILPSLTVANPFYDFDYYYVDVVKGTAMIETLKVKNGDSPLYLLEESGQFSFEYFVVNDCNQREKETIHVSVVDEKHIFCNELAAELQVGETLEIGWPYGYYQKQTYEVVCTLTMPNGEEKAITNSIYTPTMDGIHEMKYSSLIDGETIVVEQEFNVLPASAPILVSEIGNTTIHGLTELPDWNLRSEYEKGYFVTATSSDVQVRYSNIVDLSQLTKEDNLISILPYAVGDDVYMGGLQVRLTDIYDPTNFLSIEFYQPKNYPNAFCVVERNGKYYGMSNRSNLGAIEISGYNGVGTSAFNTYLNKEVSADGTSDMFCLQYDYEKNVIFVTTGNPTQQYTLLPLSDKDEKPDGYSTYERLPEDAYFNGFTSGEVFVTIRLSQNANAGYYLCEMAGVKAEDMAFELEDNFLVLDQYFEEIPSGAVGYSYKVPTATVNPAILESDTLYTQVKDPTGNIIELINGCFKPKTTGNYKLVYSTQVDGVVLEKEYGFIIKEKPTEIQIELDEQTVAFGQILPNPEIIVTGGEGSVSFVYEVVNGGKILAPQRSGGYLIAKEGAVEIVVTATDLTGYTRQKTFPVVVTDGQYCELPSTLPKSLQAGITYTLPTAWVHTVNDGVFTKVKANANVLMDGTETDIADGKIVIADTCKEIRVEYSYEYRGETVSIFKDIAVLPKQITSSCDYLFTSDSVLKTMTEAGIVLSVSNNGSAELPHLVGAEKIVVVFGFHANSPTLQSLKIVLQDCTVAEEQLIYTISDFDPEKATVRLALNDETAMVLQGTSAVYTQFAGDAETVEKYQGERYITFSVALNAEGYIVNERTSEKLFRVTKFSNGSIFKEFSNSACQVRLEWATSTETEIILSQVGNQQFNYLNDISGWLNNDSKGPEIILYENNEPEYVSKGYVVTVPKAKAFDVLQGEYEAFVRIIKDGKTLVATKSAEQTFDYVLDTYGTYTFVYEAFDSSNNRGERRLNITVKDEIAPTFSLNGTYQITAKVGESISILDYSVQDGEASVTTEQIFVKDDAGNLNFVEPNQKYKFTEKGVYEVVYRMFDASGNMTRWSVLISVR